MKAAKTFAVMSFALSIPLTASVVRSIKPEMPPTCICGTANCDCVVGMIPSMASYLK